MNGLIALVGSGEYLTVMEDIDRYLLASVNVKTPHVFVFPRRQGRRAMKASIAGCVWVLNIFKGSGQMCRRYGS
ncbi:MAG: hypothetical protein ABIQ77_10200 [Anaerolineales bacterium]